MSKVVLVTGGTSGIGWAVALKFAKNGDAVIINGRDRNKGEKCVAELKQAGSESATFIQADVADLAAVKQLFTTVIDQYKKLDILINNAGNTFDNDNLQATPEVLLHGFQLNFFSTFYCTQSAAKVMNEGAIVNVGSVCGIETTPSGKAFSIPVYSAAKAAVHNFTNTSAQMLAPKIRVNAVIPGYTKTPAWSTLEESEKAMRGQTLIQRFTEAEEVADAVYLLAINQAMTGSLLIVDGGLTVNERKT